MCLPSSSSRTATEPGDEANVNWLGASVPPAWIDSVKLVSGHGTKCLDVISERLFRVVGQLRECFERNLTCDFQADQGLNLFW